MSDDQFGCYFRACGFDDLIAAELKTESMTNLRSYLEHSGTSCNDIKDKQNLCSAIAKDTIEKMSHIASRICDNVKRLERMDNARLPVRERDIIHAIMRMFGLSEQGLTDKQKCQKVDEHYASLLAQLRTVIKVEQASSKRFPSLRKALLGLVFGLAMLTNPTCASSSQNADTCQLTLSKGNSIFDPARYVVTGNVPAEMMSITHEQIVFEDVRNRVRNGVFPGVQEVPVVTFVLGPPGSGKTTRLRDLVSESSQLQSGVSGAVMVNTDDIRDMIPGYQALRTLGSIDGIPVTDITASSQFHEVASSFTKRVVSELQDERRSMVLDRTGNNLERLASEIKGFKNNGYKVHVVVVLADIDIRRERVKQRFIRTGRAVGEDVLSKGYSENQWREFLDKAEVDASFIVNND